MRRVAVKLLWFAGIGVFLYGGFVAYERWWDGDFNLLKERVLSFSRDTAERVKEEATEAGTEVLKTAKEEAEGAAKRAISNVIGEVIQSVGESIASFGDSLGGNKGGGTAPASVGSAFHTPPPPVALTAQVGEPLTFAVNEEGSYAVSWGDDVREEGEVPAGLTTLLTHAWSAPGDYAVTLGVEGVRRSVTITFPVRIYAQ